MFSIDEETLLRHHIKEGVTLSFEQLERVRAASDYGRARNKALELLGSREHGETELYRKLCRTFDEDTSSLVVARMRELDLVDDRRFAAQYARELVDRKNAGKTAVRAKLMEKGVPRDVIADVLDELSVDESAALRVLIEKKYKNKLADDKGRKQTIAALARRGFSLRDIRSAMDDFLVELSEGEDL